MCVCVTRSSNSMLEWLAADWKKACAPISFPLPFPLFSTDKRAQCREKAEKAANASYLSLGAKGLSACRHITLRPPHTPARLNLPSNPPFPSFSSSNSRPSRGCLSFSIPFQLFTSSLIQRLPLFLGDPPCLFPRTLGPRDTAVSRTQLKFTFRPGISGSVATEVQFVSFRPSCVRPVFKLFVLQPIYLMEYLCTG